MIEYIKGTLIEKQEHGLVIETDRIAYFIHVYCSCDEIEIGTEVKIYTRLIVREDDMSLYGFLNKDSRLIFDLLKTVSGIGPRVAGGILLNMSVGEIRRAILTGDVGKLTQAPGIGKKTAERIILELKEKISKYVFESGTVSEDVKPQTTSNRNSPAVEALLSLGYNQNEIEEILKDIDLTQDISVIIREALKMMGR